MYDLETQALAQELPNTWQDVSLMRVSALSYMRFDWDEKINNNKTDILIEKNINLFFQQIEECDVLVGWGNNFLNKVLSIYDDSNILLNKKIIDLKELTHKHTSSERIPLYSIGKSLGLEKLGDNGIDAVNYFRSGQFYDLLRFVLRDGNIIANYWIKIMKSLTNSCLLVQDTDRKQVGIRIHNIQEDINKILNPEVTNDIHQD